MIHTIRKLSSYGRKMLTERSAVSPHCRILRNQIIAVFWHATLKTGS
jgi:hypothetical protein